MTSATKQKKRRINKIKLKDNFWGYVLISPIYVGIILFVVIPLALSVYASFTAWPGQSPIFDARLIGWENYRRVLIADVEWGRLLSLRPWRAFYQNLFWRSTLNTIFYMIGIPVGLILSMLAAVGMNRAIKGANAFRVIYYIPAVSSPIAIALLFRFVFQTDGLLNRTLFFLPDFWWMRPPLDRVSIIILMVWRGLGGSALLFIAGLQGISTSYYEAAKLDGASGVSIFFRITLPLLKPVIFFLVVTGIIGGAQLFVEPQMIFGDHNRYTFTVVQHIYNLRFNAPFAGMASAASVVLAILIFIVTAFQFWINGRRDKKA